MTIKSKQRSIYIFLRENQSNQFPLLIDGPDFTFFYMRTIYFSVKF